MSNLVPRRAWWMFGWLGISLFSMACLLGGCGKSDDRDQQAQKPKFEVADDDQADSTDANQLATGMMSAESGNLGAGLGGGAAAGQPAQPPSMSISQLENLTVPDGTPQELIAFINKIGQKIGMAQAELEGQPQSVVQARNQELLEAVLQASDKILASGVADQAQRRMAIDVKAGALMTLAQMSGDSQWVERIKTFGTTLSADEDPAIVVEGRSILFGLTINELAQGRSQDVDAALRQLGALLQVKPQTEVVLRVSLQAVKTLRDLGHEDSAQEAFQQIAAAFKDNPDPELAEEAALMSEQLLFTDSDMDANFNAVVVNREGAADVFLAEYGKLLGQPKLGAFTLQKGIRYISVLEQTQHYDLARKLCVMTRDAYNTSPDERLKNAAQQGTQTALRRLDLLGTPLVVEATRLDGTSLNFAAYQGRVVLVAFFQSFVPRCQQELMSVKTQYEKYHEKGFEVIAVSLDPDRDMLSQFLADASFPWVTVTNHQLAEKCGVEMVPFFLLLNQQGKVSDIYVQAASLGERLARLYGVTDSSTPPGPETSGGAADQSQHLRRRPLGGGDSRFVWAGRLGPGTPTALAADPRPLRAEDVPTRDAQQSEQSADGNGNHDDGATAAEDGELEQAEAGVNPYLARPGLSEFELINFLFDMQEKPKSIRRRPGFADAIVEAADRVLAAKAENRYQLIAAEAKFTALHDMACLGSDDADRQLAAFVAAMGGDRRPEIVRRVEFLQLEHRAIGADQLELTEIPSLLQDLRVFLEAQPKLEHRHLRLASATVHAINRLPDEARREAYFAEFGSLFAKSDDRQLARYGGKLIGSGKGQVSDLVGQPLELEGITDLGTQFDWSNYRGKVVLVAFWATWCGPCLREMPHIRALHARHAPAGFDVVAVSLDEDLEVLAKYLEENKVPWSNLMGKDASSLAAKYGVRGIPTMILVDPTGQVVAVGQKVETLEPQIQQLLEAASK